MLSTEIYTILDIICYVYILFNSFNYEKNKNVLNCKDL